MKRALIALLAVAFVVAAIGIARARSGEDEAPKAGPSTSAGDVVEKQTKAQSEEVMKAQAQLAEKVAEDKRANGRQTLILTLREMAPGNVWIVRSVSGKPTCVAPSELEGSFIDVSAGKAGPQLMSEYVPTRATLLKSGACEARVELFLPVAENFWITIGGAGRGQFEPVGIKNSDHPLKVTIEG